MQHRISIAGALMAVTCLVSPATAVARDIKVADMAALEAAVTEAQAGDAIVMANGTWRDADILFEGTGRVGAPIRLTAETPGGVVLSGASSLRLAGAYLEVSNLVFRDGASPREEIIAFHKDTKTWATHSRVTGVVIDGFNKPSRKDKEIWVALFGRHNRFDHNHVEGKMTEGVTLAVRLDTPDSNANFHQIDHNYFGPRPPLGSNGGETIRVGTSHNSLEDSNTTVEYNLFDGCSGEVEIVSNKSGANIYRGNVFYRSQGGLSLRHGNGNLVENNIFIGGGEDHTGGVRVINARQIVRNNLFIDLTGTGFAGALVVMNGVPNSPLNRYNQVEQAVIEHNTFIDVAQILFGAGADAERTLAPAGSKFRDNLVVGQTRIEATSDRSGIAFSGNLISGAQAEGFDAAQISVMRGQGVFSLPVISGGGTAGAARDLVAIARADTGVAWYRKTAAQTSDQAHVIPVSAGQNTLTAAVARAQAGDILELAGDVSQTETIAVKAPLIVRGKGRVRYSDGLFRLTGTGDLTLDGPSFAGRGPLITVAANDQGHNYRLKLTRVSVSGLSGAAIQPETGAFIQSLDVDSSRFESLGGPVLAKVPGAGVAYAAEGVTLRGSDFRDMAMPAIEVARVGTDESTFGPTVTLTDNRFERVALAADLWGVQGLTLSGNRFANSGPVRLTRQVGTPTINIDDEARKHFEYIDKKTQAKD